MLTLHIDPPGNIVLKFLLLIMRRLKKDIDGFRVGDAFKIIVDHKFQFLNQPHIATLVLRKLLLFFQQSLRKEFEILAIVLHHISDEVFNKFLCQVHIVLNIIKGHLGLDHPKLSQVPGGIGILCAESWSESVYLAKSRSRKFTLQLAAHGEVGRFPKEILFEIDGTILIAGRIVKWQGGNPEHLSRTFGITTGDNGRMDIDKPLLIKELMNSKSQCVSHPEHGPKGIGPETQVRDLPQKLQRVLFRLQGILFCVRITQNLDGRGFQLHFLALPQRRNEGSLHFKRCAGSNPLQKGLFSGTQLNYNLQISIGRTVIQCNELVVPECSHPTHHNHLLARGFAV